MSKVQRYQVDDKDIENNLKDFCDNLSKADNPIFLRKYFESLFTESELIMIARRIEVAKLLIKGLTHEEITKKLKVGLTTIRSVNSGLKKFLALQIRINKNNKRLGAMKSSYGSFDYLRKTYKGYFAIINALIEK